MREPQAINNALIGLMLSLHHGIALPKGLTTALNTSVHGEFVESWDVSVQHNQHQIPTKKSTLLGIAGSMKEKEPTAP